MWVVNGGAEWQKVGWGGVFGERIWRVFGIGSNWSVCGCVNMVKILKHKVCDVLQIGKLRRFLGNGNVCKLGYEVTVGFVCILMALGNGTPIWLISAEAWGESI